MADEAVHTITINALEPTVVGRAIDRALRTGTPAAVPAMPDARSGRYRHALAALTEVPWAITPAMYATIREILARRLAGGNVSAAELEEIRAARQPAPALGGAGIALIPIAGPIFPRANLMTEMSGATSLEQIGAMVDTAARDPQVGSIVLDVNSPGGSVELLPETAAKIREARKAKPVLAVANGTAASAAYWLAAQADEISVTPSGLVGSIGVISEHHDFSQALDAAGVRVSLIYAGRFKTEGTPTEPLGDDARAHVQSIVDHFYGLFLADVAKGRGVSTKTVREDFGEGRVLTAGAAVSAGMADRVETLEAALARLRRPARPAGRRAAADLSLEAAETEDAVEVDELVEDGAEPAPDQQDAPAVAVGEGLEVEAAYTVARSRRI